MLPEHQTNLRETVLEQLLTHIFKHLLANFQKIQFGDMRDYLKTYCAMLKLTEQLLSLFKDGQPEVKAPLAHRFPQFNELLMLVHECINEGDVEYLVVNALMLNEEVVKGKPTGITNQFWIQYLKQSGHHGDSKHRLRVQKLAKAALNCLNTLVDLAVLQTQVEQSPDKLNMSPAHYYLRSLKCVVNVANLVRQPGQWDQYQINTAAAMGVAKTVQYSIFNIVQYYVKPHIHLCPFLTHIQIYAVRFFLLCCRLWQLQPLGQRVSLESTLRTPGMTS